MIGTEPSLSARSILVAWLVLIAVGLVISGGGRPVGSVPGLGTLESPLWETASGSRLEAWVGSSGPARGTCAYPCAFQVRWIDRWERDIASNAGRSGNSHALADQPGPRCQSACQS